MSEKEEITFMQTRIVRLAAEEWHMAIEQIIDLFRKADVLEYIEKCYGFFHCESDEVVLDDIKEYLEKRGWKYMLELKNGLILYHGSYCEVRQPNLSKCAKRKDFGPMSLS